MYFLLYCFNGDIPASYVSLPEGRYWVSQQLQETPELLSFLEPFVLRSSLNCALGLFRVGDASKSDVFF